MKYQKTLKLSGKAIKIWIKNKTPMANRRYFVMIIIFLIMQSAPHDTNHDV